MRVKTQLVPQPDAAQKLLALLLDGGIYLSLIRAVVRAAFRLQLRREGDIVQRRILREEIEALEHKPEVQPIAAYLVLGELMLLQGGIQHIPADGDNAGVRHFEEIHAPQQRRLAAAGRSYHGQRLPALHGKAYALEHLKLVKALAQILNFQ